MKSLIVLQRAFLAVEFLFYSFRALSTYVFETYFTFFQLFCCVYTYLLNTDAFCLLFFCPAAALLHCVLEP